MFDFDYLFTPLFNGAGEEAKLLRFYYDVFKKFEHPYFAVYVQGWDYDPNMWDCCYIKPFDKVEDIVPGLAAIGKRAGSDRVTTLKYVMDTRIDYDKQFFQSSQDMVKNNLPEAEQNKLKNYYLEREWEAWQRKRRWYTPRGRDFL